MSRAAFGFCTLVLLGCGSAANAQIVDPCFSSATTFAANLVLCPQGDGTTLASQGSPIFIEVRDINNNPIANIPASDFWLIGCNDAFLLWAGSASSNADSLTNANGQTTISGTIAGTGCDNAVQVVVQGFVIQDDFCLGPLCLPIASRGVDLEADLRVDLEDFTEFAMNYNSPPKAYDPCKDFNIDGKIDISDFAQFASHMGHVCP